MCRFGSMDEKLNRLLFESPNLSLRDVTILPNLTDSIKNKLENDGVLDEVYSEFDVIYKRSTLPASQLFELDPVDYKTEQFSNDGAGKIIRIVFDGKVYE